MHDCRLLDLSIGSPEGIQAESTEALIELNNDFKVIASNENQITARYTLSLKPTEGDYYTVTMSSLVAFEFPNGTDDQEKEGYLKTFALMRVYDWSRAILESVSTTGVLGPIRIPPNPPNVQIN